MQTAKALTAMLLFLPLLSCVFAHEISIGSSKGVYEPGDMITIWACVLNSGDTALNLTVELLVEDLDGRVAASPISFTVTAQAGREVNATLMEALVDDSYYSGLYRASARLIDGRFVADQDELFFEVQGAPEDLSLRVLLYQDPECQEESLVFIKNERIYIRYVSSAEDVSVKASISDPSGLGLDVDLPNNFTAKNVGAYALLLTASKSGYRNLTIVKGFAVIEEEPGIAASTRKPSALYLDVGPSRIAGDTALALEGRIEPIHAEASVTLVCRKGDGKALNMTVVTDDDGRFWTRFQPEPTFTELLYALLGKGTMWNVQAIWDGDSNHLGSESEVEELVVEHEMPLEFIILGGVVILAIIGIAVGLGRRRG